ncbi:TldD/PmbA family protein [bacterium]|nr:TldD/PmbA family protein [bacterium]
MAELLKKEVAEKDIDLGRKISLLLDKTKVDEYEVYISNSIDNEVEIFEGEVESLSYSDSKGVGIRVFKEKKIGYSYSTSFEENNIKDCIEKAILNSKITVEEDINGLPLRNEYKYTQKPEIEKYLYNEDFFKATIEDKIEISRNLEKIAKGKDKRISGVDSLNYSDNFSEITMLNSHGFEGSYKSTSCFLFLNIISKEKEDTSTGFGFSYERDPKKLDLEVIAGEATKKSLMLLGSKKIKSKSADILLDNLVASQFLGIIASILTADSVQKGKSLFKNKIGEKIFKLNVNIFDNGIMKNGYSSKPFDAEGVNKGNTQIFKDGVLNTYLYDCYTARKDKTLSTGNAVRASYKSTPAVGVSNFYIEPSSKTSLKDILKSIDDGFYVTDIIGLHSGANSITGDISVGAKGLWIKNGSFDFPVKEVTIATDILSFCKNIEAIGDDLKFFPSGGFIGSPSLLIKDIAVSGI